MIGHKKIQLRYRPVIFSAIVIISSVLFFSFWRMDDFEQQLFGSILTDGRFEGVWGIFFFVGIYAGFTILLLPTLPLNVLAGFVWGGWSGGLISCVAVTIGSWMSFALSRSILRRRVLAMARPAWFERIEREIDANDWRYLVFIRINPIFPTGLVNYLVGITNIKNLPYLVCTFFPLLIPSVLIAFTGSAIKKLTYSKLVETNFDNVVLLMIATSVFVLFLIILGKLFQNRKKRI